MDVANTADTWDPPTAETEFQEAYTAHPNINAAVIPNDETGSPIISYLQAQHVAPKTFPTTGQDATATGLDDILPGYQCGTVYKPNFIEASAAVWRSPCTCGRKEATGQPDQRRRQATPPPAER